MSTLLIIYKTITILILIVFAFFISDFRKKEKMTPLYNSTIIILLKLLYLVPIGIFIYTIIKIQNLLLYDYVLPLIMSVGAFLVVKSKLDLGHHHTWVGYVSENSGYVCKGIYSYIRHPLYAGIYLIIIFCSISIAIHNPVYIGLFNAAICTFILGFIYFSAYKETCFLIKSRGKEFEIYCKTIHPFFPLKKWR